jgi:hypothetical protein
LTFYKVEMMKKLARVIRAVETELAIGWNPQHGSASRANARLFAN